MGLTLVNSKEHRASENMLVTQSNQLIEARYSLSLYEQRLVLMMVSMVEPDDEDFKSYAINVSDFRDLIGLKTKNLYPKVKNLLKNLATKVIEIPKGGQNYLITGWISDAEYKDGVVYLSFSAKLKPYLLALKKNFTSYRLGVAVQFKGMYTIRIYTLLKQYERIKERIFTIEEFRDILGISEGKYKLFADLKKHTVLKSQKEFSKKEKGAFVSDINFTFEPIKTGRKVTGLKFSIYRQDTTPKQTEIPFHYPSEQEQEEKKKIISEMLKISEVKEMINLGITEKNSCLYLDQYGAEYIKEKLKVTAEKERKSPAGFFIDAVKKDWKGGKSEADTKKIEGDKIRAKLVEAKRIKDIKDETTNLENTFRKEAKEKYISSLSDQAKEKLLIEAKKENPEIADLIDSLSSKYCGVFITSKIENFKEKQEIFIASELQKMGLISREDNDTDK